MKTLRLTLADLGLEPIGDDTAVTGEAWATYTREVRTTAGVTVALLAERQTVPASGIVEWDVLPNDDATVHPDDQGFGITVGWELYQVKSPPPQGRALPPNRIRTVNPGRTITVTSADAPLVHYALKATATPIDPLVSYPTEAEVAAAIAAEHTLTETSLAGKVAKTALLNALDYGTNGAAIQAALDLANTAGGGTVRVPAKATPWDLSASLIIYAGTHLEVNPAAVIRSTGASPLILNGTASVAGYAGQSFITITGGVWDCNAAGVSGSVRTGFAFAHARGITVRDLTIKDVGSGHAIELNAIDGAVIDNVRFDGFYNSNSRDDTEAVQFDVARTGNFPWFGNNDSTICKNVSVTNCDVTNTGAGVLWWRGVGSHNTVVDDPYTGIRVAHNRIRTRATGIRAYNWARFAIVGNVLEGGGIWVQATEVARTADTVNKAGSQTSASAAVSDGVVSGNTVTPDGITMQYHGIWLSGEATGLVRCTVTGNTVSGTNNTQAGIRVNLADSSVVVGNTVSGSAGQGVSVNDSAQVLVASNRIRAAAGAAGVHLTGASPYASVLGNLITDSQQAGILASGTSNQLSIKNNTVVGSSLLTNSGYNAIHLSSVDDCQVVGNTVRKNAAGNHAAAALFINSGCDRTWHTINDFRSSSNGVGAATINDAGTASVTTAGTLT